MCSVAQALEEKGIKKERLQAIQKMLRRGYSKEQMTDFVSDASKFRDAIFESKAFAADKKKFEVSVLNEPS